MDLKFALKSSTGNKKMDPMSDQNYPILNLCDPAGAHSHCLSSSHCLSASQVLTTRSWMRPWGGGITLWTGVGDRDRNLTFYHDIPEVKNKFCFTVGTTINQTNCNAKAVTIPIHHLATWIKNEIGD